MKGADPNVQYRISYDQAFMDQYTAAFKNYENSKSKHYKKKDLSKSGDSSDSSSSSSDREKSSEDYETEDHYDGQADNRPRCSRKCRCDCEKGIR